MIELKGYLDFDFVVFRMDVNNGKYIIFDELERDTFFDVYHNQYISYLKIETITYNNDVKVTIKFQDEVIPDAIINTTISSLNQFLDEEFDNTFKGFGKVTADVILTTTIDDINDMVDKTKNGIFLYRLNSEKNVVTKNLIWKKTLPVSFNNPIKVRDMLLNVKLGINDLDFNYVYITSLHRFYFVNDMNLTNEYAQLMLHEDILSSWDDLIRNQLAYIERNETSYDLDIVDDLVTYDYDKSITVTTITPVLDLFKRPSDLVYKQWLLTFVAKV